MTWGIEPLPNKQEDQHLDPQNPQEEFGGCGGACVIPVHSSTEGAPMASWLARQAD